MAMYKIYGDFSSQPSRACVALATIESDRIGEWEHVPLRLSKFEHRTPEFLKINPNGKAPAL